MKDAFTVGRWELGCIVFNSLVYRIFSSSAKCYIDKAGSASWLNAAFSALLFLLVLFLIARLYRIHSQKSITDRIRERFGKGGENVFKIALIIYFLISGFFAVINGCGALRETAFPKSSLWFTALFLTASGVLIACMGIKAVKRVHSLCAVSVATALLLISLFAMRYGDISNLFPILGKGGENVFLKGASNIFMYTDILVIFFFAERKRNSYMKTVAVAAALAVVLNVLITFAFSLNFSYELAEKINIPIYPLTKFASAGKLSARLDFAYLISLILTTVLYLSLALSIIIRIFNSLPKKRMQGIGVIFLCFFLCFGLCGCRDSNEIEQNAYITALGVDKGSEEKYEVTFQISNPLNSGGGGEEEDKKEKSKSTDNISVEAEDFYESLDKLKSIISKQPNMSHMKLAVYSKEIAKNDALKISEILLKEREIRPEVNLCLSDSAREFLENVNPTLEENTVRYYELFFGNEDIPYAPVSELRDFVGKSTDKAYDAVIPVIDDNVLSGMGIFHNGCLEEILSGSEVEIYKLLRGELRNAAVSGIIISSDGKVKLDIYKQDDIWKCDIKARVKIKNDDNIENKIKNEFSALLSDEGEELLYKIRNKKCDVFGFGRKIKESVLTEREWENTDIDSIYQNMVFRVEITGDKQ